jgi:integration host factor subunit alpha
LTLPVSARTVSPTIPLGLRVSEKTITRADFVEALHKRCDVSRTLGGRFLESLLGAMETALVAGDTVKLARFGNFVVREKNERVGRNPKTGEAAKITPRKVVTFRPSQLMRARVERPSRRRGA